jgi:type IV pilus assembly protein PilF
MMRESTTLSRPCRSAVVALLALCLLALPGCVTTVTGKKFTADKSQEIERRVEAANAYLNKGDTEKAIGHLRRALELDPDSATIHAALAQVFWRTGEYELSEEHFRRALSIDGKLSRGRNNYAAFLYERGRYAEAAKQLEQVVEDTLYESRAAAFVNLGKAYLKIDRATDAEQAFDRAVKMDRRQWAALLELTEMNMAKGDLPRAGRYYNQFRQTAPRQSPRSLWLGIRLARDGGNKDAEASYALQLKSLYPDSSEYREYLSNTSGK